MAIEIERKYLVIRDKLPPLNKGELIFQSYIPTANHSTVRIRLCGAAAFLTLKGPTHGISRAEFEYPIPATDAHEMLTRLCAPGAIEKHRYQILHDGMVWEIDVFAGANEGLILAEIELNSETQTFTLPNWIGAEVSSDIRYSNQALMKSPWPKWKK
jgi:CYTH domain-containing protein